MYVLSCLKSKVSHVGTATLAESCLFVLVRPTSRRPRPLPEETILYHPWSEGLLAVSFTFTLLLQSRSRPPQRRKYSFGLNVASSNQVFKPVDRVRNLQSGLHDVAFWRREQRVSQGKSSSG